MAELLCALYHKIDIDEISCDLRKAKFDYVNHELLLQKLKPYGMCSIA
jgi:hypothetical protein